ncbi:hypothetical protein [Rubripirellula tenax]|nr:hypothetical protein [Rubripirellula tenax]
MNKFECDQAPAGRITTPIRPSRTSPNLDDIQHDTLREKEAVQDG